jgi:sugar phosphate permease
MQPAPISSSVAPAPPAAPKRSLAYHRNATFAALLVGYMAYYLCRQNFSAAYAPMSAELGMNKETFGLISSVGTFAYAVGKLVSGPVADALGGRRVFLLGLFGSAGVSLVFGLANGVAFLIILWAANRLLQSFGWSGLVNVMPRWVTPAKYGTAMGAISLSYQLGAVLVPLVMGVLLAFGLGWRWLFILPAAMLTAIGLVVRVFLTQSPEDAGHPAIGDSPHPTASRSALWPKVKALISRPAFVAALGLSFVLTLLRETFGLWMPAYFSDAGASAQVAAFKSTIFPLLGVAGTLLSGIVSDRLSRGRRGPVITVSLACLTLTLLALGNTAGVAAFLGVEAASVAVTCVGLAGFFILGPYSMVGGGVVALDFGGRELAATAAGLLDGVGYVGATLAGFGVARLVADGGWGGAFTALGWMTVGALVLSAVLWRRTAR